MARLSQLFAPKEREFFNLFEEAGSNIVRAAELLARILHEASRSIAQAVPRLRTFQDIRHFTVEVNRLENEGDRVVRQALASLFERGIDPMLVIRWKDIFERLEDAIDACESTANILEGIVIKNA